MQRSKKLGLDVGAGLCVLFLVSTALAQSDDKTLVQWRFDVAGEFRGWSIGGLIADGAVRGGALHGRAIGGDPILFGPVVRNCRRPRCNAWRSA